MHLSAPNGKGASRLVFGAALAGLLVTSFMSVVAIRRTLHPCEAVGKVEDFEENSVTRIDCVPMFVVRGDREIFGILGLSTHMPGEPVDWDPRQRLFVSPAHGESVNADGSARNGPAQGPLARCPLELRGDEVWISVPSGTEDEEVAGKCEQATERGHVPAVIIE